MLISRTWILFLYLKLLTSTVCSDDEKNCEAYKWKCDDQSYIPANKLCDGNTDCDDESDETVFNCFSIECPPDSFQCSYGGCIDASLKCDKSYDCPDGSDEIKAICESETEDSKELDQGSCGWGGVYCNVTNECIERYDVCDGIKNCPDGSDETIDLCLTNSCPQYSFKCSYGACISGNAMCNGTIECWDRSDEAWNLCLPTQDSHFHNGSCSPPDTPMFAMINNRKVKEIPNNSFCRLACSGGYSLKTNSSSLGFCKDGELQYDTTCLKYCQKDDIAKEFSTKIIYCDRNTITIDCSPKMLPNTSVHLACAEYFRGNHRILTRQCQENGRWSGRQQSCDMICGGTSSNEAMSYAGIRIKAETAPWNVAIYFKQENDTKYICCGSIVSPIIIVTAAHCAVDPRTHNKHKPEEFLVIPAKEKRFYDTTEKSFQVKTIHIHPRFDYANQFKNDLAVFVLRTHLRFSNSIRPLCLYPPENMQQGYVEQPSNLIGSMTGFNRNNDMLEKITARQFSFSDCKSKANVSDLTPDKFCLISVTGASCKGDSGTGYVRQDETDKLFYLTGVLSNAKLDAKDCSANYMNVVNVFYFLEWIYGTMDSEHVKYRGKPQD